MEINSYYKINYIFTTICFIVSILTFYPGWITGDGAYIYSEIKSGIYSDWHPVFNHYIWAFFDHIYNGSELFFLVQILIYWVIFFIVSMCFIELKVFSTLFILLGLFPGLFLLSGMIIKDVTFTIIFSLTWIILFFIYKKKRNLLVIENIALFFLVLTAIGIKPNALSALPFLLFFWGYVIFNNLKKSFIFMIILFSLILSLYYIINNNNKIVKSYPIQYTQSYDLLGISVLTGENLMPQYLKNIIKDNNLSSLYYVGSNDYFFYNYAKQIGIDYGGLRTKNIQDLNELSILHKKAIFEHPKEYISHRNKHFLSLIRFGESTPAWIASGKTVNKINDFSAKENEISKFYMDLTTSNLKYLFYPYVYIILLLIMILISSIYSKYKIFTNLLGLSAIFFLIPHYFIVPASDFRYLYYIYFITIIEFIFVFVTFYEYFKYKRLFR